ncbi:hypothetical protein BJP05_05720 [Corynebacterium sp. NML98-0116]|nr:hypothetical protein BJP05_05720 [Corynebacterium sp. NML98-0116]
MELPGYSWYIDDPSSPLPNATNTAAGMASNGTAELRLRTANTTLAASSTLDPDREGSPVKIDDSGLFWAELASASAGGTCAWASSTTTETARTQRFRTGIGIGKLYQPY